MATQVPIDPQFTIYDEQLNTLMQRMDDDALAEMHTILDEIMGVLATSGTVSRSIVETLNQQLMSQRNDPLKGRVACFMLAQAALQHLYVNPAREASLNNQE